MSPPKFTGTMEENNELKERIARIFKEIVEVKKVPLCPHVPKPNEVFVCLPPCPYGHPKNKYECVPDSRRCRYCWRYWCGNCGTGLGGMMGKCEYEYCTWGRQNLLK